MDPDWDDLKILLALARGGSVAGAARTLEVDHSTVSRRLAAIEEAFGAQLLVRGGREFAWTAAGKQALAAAESVEALILEATRSLRTARQNIAGIVKVATTPSLLAVLAPAVTCFQQRYPALEFEFLAGSERADLARGDADIAVRFARPTEPDLIGRHVCDVGMGLYASLAYEQQYGLPANPAELHTHRLVLLAESMHRYGQHLRWLEDYRDERTVISRVDNFQSAEQLIAMARGIGTLPRYVADPNPALRRVFPEPHSHVGCYLVYHASLRDTARIKAACEVMRAAVESLGDRLASRRVAPEPTAS